MFLKNNMRPATAGAPASETNQPRRNRLDEAFSYNTQTSEAEDFNSFHPNAGRDDMNRRRQPQGRPDPRRQGNNRNNKSSLIIAIAAAAVVLILLLIVILAAVLGADHIEYENNAYIAYADGDGNFYVAVNGSVLDFEFEGEVEIIPSIDHSFAYVTDESADGIQVYILKGKKLTAITPEHADAVVAFADLKPGVVFQRNGSHWFYSDTVGEERITKDASAANFFISGDATTIVYTEADDDSADSHMYLHYDGSSEKIAVNCKPVALSNYGDYIYGVAKDKDLLDNLYVITTKDLEKVPVPESTGFTSIVATNVKGNEILFTALNNELETVTRLFRQKKEKTVDVATGILTPATVDPSIAVYDSFSDIYLTGISITLEGTAYPTYYLNNKYEASKIASYIGQFDPNGDYFYYINNDGDLLQMDLNDSNRAKKTLFEDVVDFAVTEKGNLYCLNDDDELRFYKLSTAKKFAISYDAQEISLYNYANEVYFSETDDVDVSIYISEEGSEKDLAKLGSTQISGVPQFSHPNSKKSYAYYYDDENGWMLFYTSNGSRFKLISQDCQAINGVDEFGGLG